MIRDILTTLALVLIAIWGGLQWQDAGREQKKLSAMSAERK